MPAVSSIIINDGTATPVSHTFNPMGLSASGELTLEQTAPVPANPLAAIRLRVSAERKRANAMRLEELHKVRASVHQPFMETLGTTDGGIMPPPTVAYYNTANIEILINRRSSAAQAKNLRVLTLNMLNHAALVALVDANELYW